LQVTGVNGAWKTLFLVAALYDVVLGIGFFFLYPPIFALLNIQEPNNTSYIHLTAAFVFVQGVGYWLVYQDPLANLGIVKLGIIYKAAYTMVALYYLVLGQLLSAIFAWLAIADVLFLIFFWRFLLAVREDRR